MTAVAVPIGFAAVAFGQGSVIYPKKGQSQEQLKKDRFEWARQQTGFDPAAPSSGGAPAAAGTRSNALRGAAGGAARCRGGRHRRRWRQGGSHRCGHRRWYTLPVPLSPQT